LRRLVRLRHERRRCSSLSLHHLGLSVLAYRHLSSKDLLRPQLAALCCLHRCGLWYSQFPRLPNSCVLLRHSGARQRALSRCPTGPIATKGDVPPRSHQAQIMDQRISRQGSLSLPRKQSPQAKSGSGRPRMVRLPRRVCLAFRAQNIYPKTVRFHWASSFPSILLTELGT
jgi:hypothetical protein